MLNLHQLGHGGEAYYLGQVVSGAEDYYGEAGEAPGYCELRPRQPPLRAGRSVRC